MAMDTIICDISAFYLYRIPPCVRALIPAEPDLSTPYGRRSLSHADNYLHYLDLPVHLLHLESRKKRARNGTFHHHQFTQELPPGHISDIGESLRITSPELTLLTMAQWLDEIQLIMAMYEMCGTFAVHRLSTEHEQVLHALEEQGLSLTSDGWEPVRDRRGILTDLWKRPALTTPTRLLALANRYPRLQGVRRFRDAALMIMGRAASPFEVQAAMSFGLPRRMGGEGFPQFLMNEPIRFIASSRVLSSGDYCVADILFPGNGQHGPLVIECQGKMAHGKDGVTTSDADRLLALQNMNVEGVLLTYEQLSDQGKYHALVRFLAHRLGIRYREKSATLRMAEINLRRYLFIDWTTLGKVTAGPRKGARRHVR